VKPQPQTVLLRFEFTDTDCVINFLPRSLKVNQDADISQDLFVFSGIRRAGQAVVTVTNIIQLQHDNNEPTVSDNRCDISMMLGFVTEQMR